MNDVMVKPEARSRTRRRRLKRARRVLARSFLLAVLAGALAVGAIVVAKKSSPPASSSLGDPADGEQVAILVAGTIAGDPSAQADSLTLFAVDRSGKNPVAMFIPVSTYGLIPGQSSIEHVGKALIFGRESLQQTTVENLLGVVIDRTVVLDDVTLARLVEAVGGVEIEVAEAIYETDEAGNRELAFPTGHTRMQGPQAVTYLTYRAEEESELDRFVRAQRFWEAVFDAAQAEHALTDAVAASTTLEAADAGALGQILDVFAGAGSERSFDVLAVDPAGGGATDGAYTLDDAAVAAQVSSALGGSLPPLATELAARPRIELLNGVGAPELGGTAAALLVPEGFKIEVTGNSSAFGNDSTRIIVYGDDEASLALAERARALLGVGSVEVGTRAQTVVDLTIVVGSDFVGKG